MRRRNRTSLAGLLSLAVCAAAWAQEVPPPAVETPTPGGGTGAGPAGTARKPLVLTEKDYASLASVLTAEAAKDPKALDDLVVLGDRVAPALADIVSDFSRSSAQRAAAVRALAGMTVPDAQWALQQAVSDPSSEVSLASLQVHLSRGSLTGDGLAGACKGRAWTYFAEAARLLAASGPEAGQGLLLDLWRETLARPEFGEDRRGAMVEIVSDWVRGGAGRATPALAKFLVEVAATEKMPTVREAAFRGLLAAISPACLGVLPHALDRIEGSEKRVRLVEAAAATRDRAAVTVLIGAMRMDEPEVRRVAHEKLAALTGVKIGPEPERWEAWWRDNAATFGIQPGPGDVRRPPQGPAPR